MIATGIVRRVDDLGRIVIPKDVRRELHIKEGDSFEIFFNRKDQTISFKKWSSLDRVETLKQQFELLLEEEKVQFLKKIIDK